MSNNHSASRKPAPKHLTLAPELNNDALAVLNAFRQAEYEEQWPPQGTSAHALKEFCEKRRLDALRNAVSLAQILSELADESQKASASNLPASPSDQ